MAVTILLDNGTETSWEHVLTDDEATRLAQRLLTMVADPEYTCIEMSTESGGVVLGRPV